MMALPLRAANTRSLSLSDWRAWLAPGWTLLRRAEKLEAVVKAVLFLAALLAALLGTL
jgi:hypothetical protein